MARQLGDNLTVQDGAPMGKATPPAKKVLPRVGIILEDNEGIPPTGLFVSYNGQTFMLRTGVEMMVPAGVAEILNNAITSVPVVDPYTLRVTGSRNRTRFPFRYVTAPPPSMAA